MWAAAVYSFIDTASDSSYYLHRFGTGPHVQGRTAMTFLKRLAASAFLAGVMLLGGVNPSRADEATQVFCRDISAIEDIITAVRMDVKVGDTEDHHFFLAFDSLTAEGRCREVTASDIASADMKSTNHVLVGRYRIGWWPVTLHHGAEPGYAMLADSPEEPPTELALEDSE